MGDKTRGLYHKFDITRTDGTSVAGQKHDGCDYFVLDLTHDPFALWALRAYHAACRMEYPLLAVDLEEKISVLQRAMDDASTAGDDFEEKAKVESALGYDD